MIFPVIIPVAVFSFLGGAALGRSRNVLSMLPPERPSPLPGVPAGSWGRFVSLMVIAPRSHVSPRGRFGYFGTDARSLADVGFMTSPRKTTVGSETGVWTGEWVSPLTKDNFLGSAPAQYEAFCRSMRRLAPAVRGHVGKLVDGRPASLSGLLAAAHLSGASGIGGWVADPGLRSKFKATTANFKKTNGLF